MMFPFGNNYKSFMENVVGTYEDFFKFLTTNDVPEVIKERTKCFVEGYQQGTDWRKAY